MMRTDAIRIRSADRLGEKREAAAVLMLVVVIFAKRAEFPPCLALGTGVFKTRLGLETPSPVHDP
jgi:hypothetical protein